MGTKGMEPGQIVQMIGGLGSMMPGGMGGMIGLPMGMSAPNMQGVLPGMPLAPAEAKQPAATSIASHSHDTHKEYKALFAEGFKKDGIRKECYAGKKKQTGACPSVSAGYFLEKAGKAATFVTGDGRYAAHSSEEWEGGEKEKKDTGNHRNSHYRLILALVLKVDDSVPDEEGRLSVGPDFGGGGKNVEGGGDEDIDEDSNGGGSSDIEAGSSTVELAGNRLGKKKGGKKTESHAKAPTGLMTLRLTEGEFIQAMTIADREEYYVIFNFIDTNSDGEINFEEFLAALPEEEAMKGTPSVKGTPSDSINLLSKIELLVRKDVLAQALFNKLPGSEVSTSEDRDTKNVITFDEFRYMFSDFSIRAVISDLFDLFFDRNHDGKITLDEFKEGIPKEQKSQAEKVFLEAKPSDSKNVGLDKEQFIEIMKKQPALVAEALVDRLTYHMMAIFDNNKDQKLDIDEFRAYLKELGFKESEYDDYFKLAKIDPKATEVDARTLNIDDLLTFMYKLDAKETNSDAKTVVAKALRKYLNLLNANTAAPPCSAGMIPIPGGGFMLASGAFSSMSGSASMVATLR